MSEYFAGAVALESIRMARHTGAVLVALLCAACGRLGFDAPSEDAAPIDARGPDGASDPCAQRLFCDSFDDGLAKWDGVEPLGATVRHEPAFGRSGGSVHAIAPAGTATATLYEDLFTALPAAIYIRMFVFAPSGMLLDLEPLELADVAGAHQIVFSIYDSSIDIHAHAMAGDFMQMSPMDTPRDRWVCMELHVHIGATGSVELFVDGQPLLAQLAVDTRPPTGELSRMRVGIPSKPAAIPGDLYIDDLVVDTAPIGCD